MTPLSPEAQALLIRLADGMPGDVRRPAIDPLDELLQLQLADWHTGDDGYRPTPAGHLLAEALKRVQFLEIDLDHQVCIREDRISQRDKCIAELETVLREANTLANSDIAELEPYARIQPMSTAPRDGTPVLLYPNSPWTAFVGSSSGNGAWESKETGIEGPESDLLGWSRIPTEGL
jgi:hypothetical protein